MKDALPDTRAYPGCISVDTYFGRINKYNSFN
jgi:hypothetical protein